MQKILDDPQISNIELGAGRGVFGRQFFPDCYLTDNNWDLINVHNVTSLDCICSADSVPSPDGKYNTIILCNPFGYGFNGIDESFGLFNEFERLLRKDGKVIIIGHSRNKYCAPERIQSRLTEYNRQTGKSFGFDCCPMPNPSPYNGYIFEQCDFRETKPNFILVLTNN